MQKSERLKGSRKSSFSSNKSKSYKYESDDENLDEIY